MRTKSSAAVLKPIVEPDFGFNLKLPCGVSGAIVMLCKAKRLMSMSLGAAVATIVSSNFSWRVQPKAFRPS